MVYWDLQGEETSQVPVAVNKDRKDYPGFRYHFAWPLSASVHNLTVQKRGALMTLGLKVRRCSRFCEKPQGANT